MITIMGIIIMDTIMIITNIFKAVFVGVKRVNWVISFDRSIHVDKTTQW